jgi:polysaccharide deacetylase family protein (PEP-CTERM system associated)
MRQDAPPVVEPAPRVDSSMSKELALGVLNAMTVDVEEHFQVSAFENTIPRDEWGAFPSRVEPNTSRLLDLFDEVQVKATFFVLGWVAERHGELVRRIATRGHEVACHGYSHRLVYTQTPAEFKEETVRAKALLQDLTGSSVRGYRAASFSIGRKNLWALDVLAEAGFEYDSSLFPVVHDRYGIPGAPRHAFIMKTRSGGRLVEVPPSTIRWGRLVVPFGGGGYLRLFPAGWTRWALGRLNDRERMPAVVYVHPWETDPGQPRVAAPWRSRFRHYVGLDTTLPKLRDLASRYRFGTMVSLIDEAGSLPEEAIA